MLPVEIVAVTVSPIWRAMAMTVSEPRSLKLQVGFTVSFFKSSRRMPVNRERAFPAGRSGVSPSPRVRSRSITTGRKSAKRSQRCRPGLTRAPSSPSIATSRDSPLSANSPMRSKGKAWPEMVDRSLFTS